MSQPATDIDALLVEYRSLLQPRGPDRDVAYRRRSHAQRYAEDAHVFFPGNAFLSGHHRGRTQVDALWQAAGVVWPQGTRLHKASYFVGEDSIAIEWASRNRVWNGVEARNSGVGRLRFRGDRVVDHHEITDTEFFDEVHGDWRSQMDPQLGAQLPSFRQAGPPWYPDPPQAPWAHDEATSDGTGRLPAAMREMAEELRAALGAHDLPPMNCFAEDVDIFFQGRSGPLGGHHRGRAGVERLRRVIQQLWPDGHRLVRANLWANESQVLVEWFVEYTLWNGRAAREGGFSVFDIRDSRTGRIQAVRSYLDTLLHAELLAGWRKQVGERLGSGLPNWPEPRGLRFPDPASHE